MTKPEFIRLLNLSMMENLRKRDNTDPNLYDEEYGYYNGQYRAYEAVINLVTTMQIEELQTSDSRNFV